MSNDPVIIDNKDFSRLTLLLNLRFVYQNVKYFGYLSSLMWYNDPDVNKRSKNSGHPLPYISVWQHKFQSPNLFEFNLSIVFLLTFITELYFVMYDPAG